ncbi:hypothetical protein [Mycobacterium uberis]|uniref:hypothetical protein n=1 Tax=Mycobacterium uberis TaxID=2162698 RepID=UPI001FB55E73|nr:hypothetical protein [Mycobacterium uberis]
MVAGDICAISKLSRAETGGTFSDKAEPLVLKPCTILQSPLPVATQAHAKIDENKLAVGLGWVDCLRSEIADHNRTQETRRVVLWSHGRSARRNRIALNALANSYGVIRALGLNSLDKYS